MNKVKEKINKFWERGTLRTSRRGEFWITGNPIEKNNEKYQDAPMFVSWESPEKIKHPYPVVLIHGGLFQSTEWMDTPDGRPGWAQRLVEAGFTVFNVDRTGHGRSHSHPELSSGTLGTPFSYKTGRSVFFPQELADQHTQWVFDPEDHDAYDAFIAGFSALPTDLEQAQITDVDRLSKLLEKIGPAIIFTHSASGPLGWLLAEQKKNFIKGIVTVEPMGPAFGTIHGLGYLKYGWTAAEITYNKSIASFEDLQKNFDHYFIPALKELPIAVITGEASPFTYYVPELIALIKRSAAKVHHLHLPDYGVLGNGHGLIYEKNSDEALQPVLQWIENNIES
ncbi:alpha/beta fold hydrolase [Flavobacterium sp. J27]|uniref:alpha/beta fold hydrolase n=1 Tax=Flavobacterium sp. J27 TaxID=2060419 RepID=UPI001030A588|nr:alpha/beta fold hydrolase [Flavobacterium sp. J27]